MILLIGVLCKLLIDNFLTIGTPFVIMEIRFDG